MDFCYIFQSSIKKGQLVRFLGQAGRDLARRLLNGLFLQSASKILPDHEGQGPDRGRAPFDPQRGQHD